MNSGVKKILQFGAVFLKSDMSYKNERLISVRSSRISTSILVQKGLNIKMNWSGSSPNFAFILLGPILKA